MKKQLLYISLIVVMGNSCLPFNSLKKYKQQAGKSEFVNDSNSVNSFHGRILDDNPLILSGNPELSYDVDLNSLLGREQIFISNTGILEGFCTFVENEPCYSTLLHPFALPLEPHLDRWAFDANSNDFLEVHTFAHMKRIIDLYMQRILLITEQNLDPEKTAIPGDLLSHSAHWKTSMNKPLIGYANCDLPNNASYDPANFSICLGQSLVHKQLKMAHDPSVIYHEIGHAFIDILMNTRNVVAGIPFRSELGFLYYDEGRSISEGIADYFMFFVNKRTLFAEWAFGKSLQSSRPLREDEFIHSPGISLEQDARLSYPHYLFYNAFDPKNNIVDIHLAGQIISHYLVELTKDLAEECSITEDKAIDIVFHLIAEVFSEQGDLTSLTYDTSTQSNHHLNADHSHLWITEVRPMTYRNFAQSMGKYLKIFYSDISSPLCGEVPYPRDRIEQVLDMYGLLLFKTYNEDGNGSEINPSTQKFYAHSGEHTRIASKNKKYSTLISKELLGLNDIDGRAKFFVLDERKKLISILSKLKASGQIYQISDQITSHLDYNNSNGQISPGEFLGIALDLKNYSNTMMSGIRILANDWDHTKDGKPCDHLGDSALQIEEDIPEKNVHGDCSYITRQNGDDGDKIMPVCLMQINDQSSTYWATQEEFRSLKNFDKSLCLGGSENTQDCYIRSVKGGSVATFPRIDPNKSFVDTIFEKDALPIFQPNNLLFFETNRGIEPGTRFLCRLRASFSNCSDCHSNSEENDDDYADFEYSGHKPFKIIDIDFTVFN